MEASALTHAAPSPQALLGRTPLLRLQGDDKLVAMTRRGHPGAFDALVHRYQARLQSFCRHMLGSTEDAEDVLQEVFASAYNAMLADDRPINVRPWLYRIARNRSLNHLRRPRHAGQDSMDIFERAGGETTADAVHRREDFRLLIADVRGLPETQKTALLMREIDALSYEHIAEAMETTVPSVKSLLVRARVGLAEAAEARMLSCDDVRLSLAGAAEGIGRISSPVRRHVKSCDRCRAFRGELRRTTRALAAVYPVGPLVILQKLLWGKLGLGGGSSAGAGAGSSAVGGSTFAGGGTAFGGSAAASGSAFSGGLLSGGAGVGGLLSTGVGAIATKAAAGLVAAAVVTAGAVEIKHAVEAPSAAGPPAVVAQAQPPDAVMAMGTADTPVPAAVAAAEELAPTAENVGGAPAADETQPTPETTEPAAAPTEETTVSSVTVESAPDTGGSSSPETFTDGGGSGSGSGDPGPSDGGSDPGSDGGSGDGSSPPADGGGEEPPPPPPAPAGEPTGSSTGATPDMHFRAGEPAGARR